MNIIRKPGSQLERHRQEQRWQKANRRLDALRHGSPRRCRLTLDDLEGELLETLDVAEYGLGVIDARLAKATDEQVEQERVTSRLVRLLWLWLVFQATGR